MTNNDKTNESINKYVITTNLNDIANNPAVSGVISLIAPVFGGMAIDTINKGDGPKYFFNK